MAARSKPNEIKIVREYDAPVALVWEAWTDPEQTAQWWGPRGFTLTTHSKDLRPGGTWDYTMHGPDGVDYPNTTLYHEVEEHSRLVYDHGASRDRPPLFRVTVQFTDLGERTRMEMTMTLPTPEAAEETKKFIKKAGGNATWDRLAEYLEENSSGKEVFVINRSFAAPLEVIFDMWTKPEHLTRWLAPKGFSMRLIRGEIQEGKSTFFSMSDGEHLTMYGRFHYVEIDRPNRIVYSQQFCDEQENISRHPMAPMWPETMLTTITFAAEDEGQTRVTVTTIVHGDASEAERTAFGEAKGGMTQGWSGSFDALDEYLPTLNR